MSITTDPWLGVLQQLEPAYLKWKDILEGGPKINAILSRNGLKWRIRLEEANMHWTSTGALDERVEWTLNQLKNWPGVTRMSFDIWQFATRRDAEKFQTLYNLKWSAE